MLVGAGLRRRAALVVVGLVVGAGVHLATPQTVAGAGFSCSDGPGYTVKSGDSWFGIADRVSVGVSSLLTANSATADDLLLVGDRLCLPAEADVAAACGQTYTVLAGDSWNRIAARSGVSTTGLTGANGVGSDARIHPGDRLCLPNGATNSGSSSSSSGSSAVRSGVSSYTIGRGDSWSAIAERADVSVRSLLQQNSASSGDLIVPGQVIALPAGATQPSSAPTSWVELDSAPTQGPCGYGDTWGEARSSIRRHQGVDIFSGNGAYVYATVDGRLSGRVWDGAGRNSGNAWTLTGADGTGFFYAHLRDFAPDLTVGSRVQAGQIIGWAGSTGNSSAPHLHFEIRPGGGAPVNPYPILRAQGGCNSGTPYTQPGGWVPN